MKLKIKRPGSRTLPVLVTEGGQLAAGTSIYQEQQPEELTPAQALQVMLSCVLHGWEWEIVA